MSYLSLPDEKEKEDIGLWSGVDAQAAFLGPNIWGSPNNADFKVGERAR